MKFKNKYYEFNKSGSAYKLIWGVRKKTISHSVFLNEINNNISPIHPADPFFYFYVGGNTSFLQKIKSLNFLLELLRDEDRIIFKSEEEKMLLNSVTFIAQKFTYSLIHIFDHALNKKTIVSPLWISSIGKLFIESISFWKFKNKLNTNQRVKQSAPQKIYKIWQRWSNWSHNLMEYPYIKANVLNMASLYKELLLILNDFIDEYLKSVINYSKDKETKKWIENFYFYYKRINQPPLPKDKFYIITWENNASISMVFNELLNILNFFYATGYSNWSLLRYFNYLINDKKTKEIISNFSHIDLYSFMDIVKYKKDNKCETFIRGLDSAELFIDTLLFLSKYFYENYKEGNIIKVDAIE